MASSDVLFIFLHTFFIYLDFFFAFAFGFLIWFADLAVVTRIAMNEANTARKRERKKTGKQNGMSKMVEMC